MSWLVITIIAYFLLAIVSLGDKFLIDKVLPSGKVYAFLISMLSGLAILIAPWFLSWPGVFWLIIDLIVGGLFPFALFYMFEALRRGDASRVIVLIGGLIPIFTIILSYCFFQERFSLAQWLGIIGLIFGTFILAMVKEKKSGPKNIGRQAFYLALISAIFYALSFIGTKYVYNHQNFISSFIWIRFGAVLVAFSFLIRKKDREEILMSLGKKSEKKERISLGKRLFVLGNQAVGAVAFILQNYAISLGSVAIINALQGVQYGFLLLFGWILTMFQPGIIKEDISRRVVWRKIMAILLISLGLYFIAS